MPNLKLKTSKSARKRFKVSSKGKMQRRSVHMNHFNAKYGGAIKRRKHSPKSLAVPNEKDIKNLMPYI